MARDINSNKYTFIFSAVMVIVVALVLAIAAEGLKPMQKANMRNEKMQNILASAGIESEATEAEALFDKHITEQIMLNVNGEVVNDPATAPFDVDAVKEYKSLTAEERNYPLYICTVDNGNKYFIVPMAGKGLWGPIWGYMALNEDMKTVFGATFDHKGETPGLGAEIKETAFQQMFVGKKIFDGHGAFTSVKVLKGGAGEDNMHGVDAISGGTITSNGVSEMIERTLKVYEPYFKNNMNN